MTTREDYIEAVKVKLEEISPFDEPQSFIAANGDTDYAKVKPIVSYIDETLDEATRNCLRALPLSLLHADVQTETLTLTINSNTGVATSPIVSNPNRRYIRIKHEDLERDITTFITSEDSLYLIMQNKHVRPKQAKTMAVVSSDTGQMEIYTLKPTSSTSATLAYIDLNKKVGVSADYNNSSIPLVQSPIGEWIVLECAAMVSDILGNAAAAQVCRQEQQSKAQSILQ